MDPVLADLEATDGATTATRRLALARKVYAHTAAYDGAIAAYLSAVPDDALTRPAEPPPRAPYPGTLTVQWRKQYDLRYGENPHQSAAFYADAGSPLPRTPVAGRADHAARLLLSHMAFLEELTHDDHAILAAQPGAHGPLFAWLEAQFHEHGPLAWAVLRESLREHECEELAVKVMTGSHAQTEGELHELRLELRDLLGYFIALALTVPLLNLVIPILGVAVFTHQYHRLAPS